MSASYAVTHRMEPQNLTKINLQKAVSAHEQAEAAMADLIENTPGAGFEVMLERLQQNLAELRNQAAVTPPDQTG